MRWRVRCAGNEMRVRRRSHEKNHRCKNKFEFQFSSHEATVIARSQPVNSTNADALELKAVTGLKNCSHISRGLQFKSASIHPAIRHRPVRCALATEATFRLVTGGGLVE